LYLYFSLDFRINNPDEYPKITEPRRWW